LAKHFFVSKKAFVEKLLFWLVFTACIFNGVQFQKVFFGLDFRMWQLALLFIGLTLLSVKHLYLNKKIVLILCALILHAILVSLFNRSLEIFSIIQILLMAFSFTILYSLVLKLGAEKILKAYYMAACFLAVVLIIEAILYFVSGINMYDTSTLGPFVRARGFLTEPSEAAVLIAPAVLIGLIWQRGYQVYLLILAAILTFSSLTYLSLLIVFFMYLVFQIKQNSKKTKRTLLMFLVVFLVVVISPNVQERVGQMTMGSGFVGNFSEELSSYQEVAGSAATLIFNANIAWKTIEDTNGLGVGFGAFRFAFDKYSGSIINLDRVEGLFYNRAGGGNLTIRVITELGLLGGIGLLFFVWSVYKSYGLSIKQGNYGRVNQATVASIGVTFVVLLVFIIRKDMWFSFYLILFLSLYFASLKSISKKTNKKEHLL
jgi:hypothetical protein